MSVAFMVLGLVLVVWGANILVEAAESIAKRLNVKPFLIGVTLVAAGTSLPEMAVGLIAAWSGESGLVAGNVIGSNIANILLVLGLGLVIATGPIRERFQTDIGITLALTLALTGFALDGRISAYEGALLCLAGLMYGISLVRRDTKATDAISNTADTGTQKRRSLARLIGMVTLGVGGLTFGGRLLVVGALDTAASLGIASEVIGLTVIAIGTSLPEVATTVSAFRKGSGGLAVGNVLGSCVFNIASVVGLSAIVAAGGLTFSSEMLLWHTPIALVSVLLLFPVLDAGRTSRAWGTTLLITFVAYIAHVVTNTLPIAAWLTLGASAGLLILLTLSEQQKIGVRREGEGLQLPRSRRDAA